MPEKIKVCELLREAERILTEYPEIPASDMGLFHVRRALELIRCSPKHPVRKDEREMFERGFIIE